MAYELAADTYYGLGVVTLGVVTGAFQVCPGVLLHPSGSVGTFASNFGPGNTSTEFYGRSPMVDVL